jgi:hypothetical protein
VHDFCARVAALGLGDVGSAAPGFAAVYDAVGHDVLFFLLDFDETHLDASSLSGRRVVEMGGWGARRCDAIAL